MQITTWNGCYDDNWKGVITDKAFQHPAKFARGLITRIIRHGLEQRYWKIGDRVGDLFGGIGSGGVIAAYHGLRWVGCELEKTFFDMANDNFEIHRHAWEASGDPFPVMINGDSRNFAALVAGCDAITSSPPYAESEVASACKSQNPEGRQGTYKRGHGFNGYSDESPGQIGSLKSGDLDSVVSSPPYAETGSGGNMQCGAVDTAAWSDGIPRSMGPSVSHPNGYGCTQGQIGALKSGDLDSCISSPPFADSLSPSAGIDRERRHTIAKRLGKKIEEVTPADIGEAAEQDSYGKTPGQIGSLEQGQIAAVVSSPLFSVDQPCASQAQALKDYHAFTRGDGSKRDQVMVSEGNIQACPTGSLDSAITSPPYAACVHDGNGIDQDKLTGNSTEKNSQAKAVGYGNHKGQIGNLQGGSLNSVVSSPPYAESIQGDHAERETAAESQAKRVTPGGSLGQSQRNGGYGATDGNIGNLKEGELDAVATSPPYEEGLGHGGGQYKEVGNDSHKGKRAQVEGYGNSNGQIGNAAKQTYWQAVSLVYRQMHIALKPGGIAALVVKNYVSKGKIVDLIGQTVILLEHLGFDVFEETRCSLVKEKHYHSLFEDEQVITTKTERKSFFKRLAESKGSPRIDYESVIWCRKRDLNAASAGPMDSGT